MKPKTARHPPNITKITPAMDHATEANSRSNPFAWGFLDTVAEAYEADGKINEMDKVLTQLDELTAKVYGQTHQTTLASKN